MGGNIFVADALIANVSSENALSMVIAHELGHIYYRHPIQQFASAASLQLAFTLIFGSENSFGQETLIGHSAGVATLSFGRDMEREADEFALSLLRKVYGHTYGAEEFFTYIQSQHESDEHLLIYSSHPGTEERIETIANAQKNDLAKPLVPMSSELKALVPEEESN